MAALPFFHLLPPAKRGPVPVDTVGFAFQPALGITAAMVEVPVATSSGEWLPPKMVYHVIGSDSFQHSPPEFSRRIPVLGGEQLTFGAVSGLDYVSSTDLAPLDSDGRGPAPLPVYDDMRLDAPNSDPTDATAMPPRPRG